MEIRFGNSPKEVAAMNTDALRKNFLCDSLVQNEKINLVYSHYDRMIIGGAKPIKARLVLGNSDELKASYFLERREMGIINVGGPGIVHTPKEDFHMDKLSCLYLGKGTMDVSFVSLDDKNPAIFYILSCPAHAVYPSVLMTKEKASPVSLGSNDTSNQRTIYKYIHNEGIQSCQLVMGLTILQSGSVWNSVPPHTHTRRMEVYFYFDLPDRQRVFHFMGDPEETRHILMSNHEAVISPPWSVHFGAGTANYGFIWGMAGENKEFNDMDPAALLDLK